MKLAKVILPDETRRIAVVDGETVQPLDLGQVDNCRSLSDILHSADPAGLAKFLISPDEEPLALSAVRLLAPLDHQEVWAAGVTYKRSQVARMEESESGASHYDKVYTADRPELFFKGMANRVSGPGEPVRVRRDSDWTVPEPEVTLVIAPNLKLVGFTIGNDMSARDIEGENPLYLPQAKVYDQCCGLGPWILLADEPFERTSTKVELVIRRDGDTVFEGDTNLGELARKFEDLIRWLGRETTFANGAFLLTGTGVVPPDEFSLEAGDEVSITVTGIGTLTNPVIRG